MSYTDRNLNLTNLALEFGRASQDLGFAHGGGSPDGVVEEARHNERKAWQAFSDALWGKDLEQPTEGAEGVKSGPTDLIEAARKIDTYPGGMSR